MKIYKIIFIAAIILFRASALHANEQSRAEFEYESKNYSAAYEIWRRRAQLDDPTAISGLGLLYLFGHGVTQDQKKGFQLLKKAAELGDARGQSGLGLIFYQGYGVSKDLKQAAYWFERAAQQDRHQAQFNLAWMYQYGQGVTQDLELAAYWHQRASDLGNIHSKTQLAILYAAGRGVKQDDYKSFLLASEAAEHGEILAQNHLGDIYAYGNGVNRDYAKAEYWYRRTAEKGDAYGQSALAYLYWNGWGVGRDLNLALDWFKKAAEQGNVHAINHLGLSFFIGGEIDKDLNSAASWFKKGAAVNDDFSKAMLGYMFEFGKGVPRDRSFATEWYSKISNFNERSRSKSRAAPYSISYKDLSKLGILEGVPRLPISYNFDQNSEFISAVVVERLRAWNELALFLRSTENYSIILSAYEDSNYNSAGDLFDPDVIERRKYEIKGAITVLDQLYGTPDVTSQLSTSAFDWLSIINARLRSKDDLERSQHLLLEIGTRLVDSYKSPDILYIEGARLLWEYHVNNYYRSRSVDYKKDVADILKKLDANLMRPDVLIAQAYFHGRGEYASSYCNVLASSLIISSATPPIAEIDIATFRVRLYRTILDDSDFCAKQSQEAYISMVKGLATAFDYARKSKEMVALESLIESVEPRVDESGRAIDLIVKRGRLFGKIGKYKSAFVEFIQARQLIFESLDFVRLADANRALSGALLGLGDSEGAISLLLPQLHVDYLDSEVYSYCSNASAINRASKASIYASIGLSALKTCIELFFDESKWVRNKKSFVDWFLFENFFKELEEALISAGRLAEAQVVMDMFHEQEHLEFTRGNDGAKSRQARIGYTPTEQRWMLRYREIADRLVALGKEEQALLKLAEGGLTDEQSRRLRALAADLNVAQKAFESFLDQMRQEFAAQGVGKQIEVSESSAQALSELRALIKSLGEDVALLQIRVRAEQVSLVLTTPGVQLARSVDIKLQDLNRRVAAFNRLLRDPKSDPLPAAQDLYKLLFASVEQDLQQAGARTVMLALDGVLRYLPFGALHDGQRFALQRWNLPIYTSHARERLRDMASSPWQAVGLGVTRAHGNFKALPAVRSEMSSIIRTARSGVLSGEVYLDEAFTAQRLKGVSNRRFSVVHVASHFQFSPGTEVNSFLLLGDGSRLTLGDIRTQNYRFDDVDLLTLSACETGLGGGWDQQGREIEGFGVIAQQQGAKAVLATLWQVADSSTATLMGDMYRRRTNYNLSKIEALRQAQIALSAQARTAHPFYWAPFVLMGNWK